jgi:hypothetical protein
MDVSINPPTSTSPHNYHDVQIQPLINRGRELFHNVSGRSYELRVVELPIHPTGAVSIQFDDGMFERTGTLAIVDFDRRDGHLLRTLDL